DLIIQETILKDLEKKKVELLSFKEPDLNGNDKTRVMIRQILGAVMVRQFSGRDHVPVHEKNQF
ncbi:hypothetical protein ACFLZG_08250, partial [Thermodesulfobacteriota bacterium]